MFHAYVTQPNDVVRAAMLAYRVSPTFADDVEMVDTRNPQTSARTVHVRLSGKNVLVDVQGVDERRLALRTGDKIQTYRLVSTPYDLTQSTSISRLPGLDRPLSGDPEDLLNYLFFEDTYLIESPLWDSPAVRWVRQGVEAIDGKPCDVVRATTSSGKFTFWVDQKSHYFRQISISRLSAYRHDDKPYMVGAPPYRWQLEFHPRANVRTAVTPADFRLPTFTSLPPLEAIHPTPTLASLPHVQPPNWISAKQAIGGLPKVYEANLPLRDYATAADGHRMEIVVDRNHAYRVLSSSADGKDVVVEWSDGLEARHWTYSQTEDTVCTVETRVKPAIHWLISSTPTYGQLSLGADYPSVSHVTYWPSALPSMNFDSHGEIWTDDGQPLQLGDRLGKARFSLENLDGKAVYHLTQTFDPPEQSWPKLTAYQLWFDANTGLLLRAVRTSKEERSLPSSDVVDMHPIAHARLRPSDLNFQPPALDMANLFP